MKDFSEYSGPMVYWEKIEWVDEVVPALDVLSKHYKCYVASNAGDSTTELMIEAFERMNGTKYFENFFTSKDLGYEKPDKGFFEEIMLKLDAIPEECIMIGNDYNKDIVGAKNAGMKTIYLCETDFEADFIKADRIIYSMQRLISAVEALTFY